MYKQALATIHAHKKYGAIKPEAGDFENGIDDYIAGWEAHEAQSPSDAVALLKQVPQQMVGAADGFTDYDFLQEVNDFLKALKATPSGAVTQVEGWAVGDKAMDNMLRDQGSLKADPPAAGPVTADSLIAILESIQGKISDFAERAHSEFGRNVLHHQIGDLHIAIKVVKDFSKNEMIFPLPSPQPPAGPVWVKCSVRMPHHPGDPNNHWRLDGFHKVNGNFYNDENGEIVFGVHGNGLFKDYSIRKDKFNGIEWLDETNTQQVFTREQIEDAFNAGKDYGEPHNDWAKSFEEYMNINYPINKP